MRILVTGGAGFIASHVVDAMVEQGHEVAVVDNVSTGFRNNVHPAVAFYEVDIRDPEKLEAVFDEFRPELVNHHAAQMDVRVSTRIPAVDAEINIIGSIHLLESAVRHGVRKIIYASTGGAVYGEPAQLPVREDHTLDPVSPYGISKHTVEHYLYLYHKHYGLDYTVLRYPNVYGPRQNPHGEAGVVAIFLKKVIRGEPPVIFGDGTQERDYVYVTDVVEANVQAMHRGSGMILNLGSGKGTSVLEVLRAIEQAVQRSVTPVFGPPRIGEIQRIALDAARAGEVLGWNAKVSLEEGIRRTFTFFQQQGIGAP
jgi:UDP-glucose 4-epimerase